MDTPAAAAGDRGSAPRSLSERPKVVRAQADRRFRQGKTLTQARQDLLFDHHFKFRQDTRREEHQAAVPVERRNRRRYPPGYRPVRRWPGFQPVCGWVPSRGHVRRRNAPCGPATRATPALRLWRSRQPSALEIVAVRPSPPFTISTSQCSLRSRRTVTSDSRLSPTVLRRAR